jgi:hypothetical protein
MTTERAPDVVDGVFDAQALRLVGGRCRACEALRFPAAPVCARCQSDAIDRVPLSDRGTIHTFTIVRAEPPGYAGPVPYAIGVVTLPDGIRVASTLTADNLDDLAIDDPVALELITLGDAPADAVTSYAFRLLKAMT